jgi:hypothetical protein
MHMHRTAAWRWLSDHRHELALSTALAATTTILVIVGPALLALAILERVAHKRRCKTSVALTIVARLARAVTWLWRELHDQPHGRWHPCTQCGKPIEEPSRAAYCSHTCRSYARLERDAQAHDPRIADRAQRRLRAIRLREIADRNSTWDEVPF